jgi:hypothetical protein
VAAGPPGVMVRPFKGPRSKTIEDAVISAFEKAGTTLVPTGFEGSVELGSAPAAYVQVAKENNIQAYVTGKVKMAKQGWSLELGVRSGKDGKPLGSEMLTAGTLPGLLDSIKTDLMETLEAKLRKAKAPGAASSKETDDTSKKKTSAKKSSKKAPDASEDAEATVAEPVVDASPEPSATSTSKAIARPVPLDLTLSAIGGYRTFVYNQPIGDAYNYALQAPRLPYLGAKLGGHWYPGAHLTTGAFANLGLAFAYYQSFGGQTSAPAPINKKFPTSVVEFDLGLRYRVELGDYRLGLNAGWGKQQTVVRDRTNDPRDTGIVPDADYAFYRFGPDVEAGWLGLDWKIGVMYRAITVGKGAGQIGDQYWFPGASANGVEATLDIGIPLSNQWSIAVAGEFRQIGIDMHSKADAIQNNQLSGHAVAGGATDRYLIASLGLRWKMDFTDTAKPSAAPAKTEAEWGVGSQAGTRNSELPPAENSELPPD